MTDSLPRTLIVTDQVQTAERFATWLTDLTEPVVQNGEGLGEPAEPDFDFIIVDHSVATTIEPDVLSTYRAENERCRIAAIVPENAEPDLVGEEYDALLREPVDEDRLRRWITMLIIRTKYDESIKKFYDLVTKRTTAEQADPIDQMAREERIRLRQEIAATRETVDRLLNELTEFEEYPDIFETMVTDR